MKPLALPSAEIAAAGEVPETGWEDYMLIAATTALGLPWLSETSVQRFSGSNVMNLHPRAEKAFAAVDKSEHKNILANFDRRPS